MTENKQKQQETKEQNGITQHELCLIQICHRSDPLMNCIATHCQFEMILKGKP